MNAACMQGNCSQEVSTTVLGLSGSPLLDRLPGQCVIVTDVHLVSVKQNFWMHGLYIRHHRTARTQTDNVVVWCGTEDCNLWLTSVTVQGDGTDDPSRGGLEVNGGQLYAEGATSAQESALVNSSM